MSYLHRQSPWRIIVLLCIGLNPLLLRSSSAFEPQVKADEQITFFPAAGRWDENRQSWQVFVQGWIYEPEPDSITRQIALRRMRQVLGLEDESLTSQLFEQRVRWFLVDNERGKRVAIQIADQIIELGPSSDDGQFAGQVQLARAAVERHARNEQIGFRALLPRGDQREFLGIAYLRPNRGITVISDIDDTIKVSQVNDKRELVRRTFFLPFEAAPGMSRLYQQWARTGVEFHYLSASPWQLFEPLYEFLEQQQFPLGTMQMKRVRLKSPSVSELFGDPEDYKLPAIERQLLDFPGRRFVLVGDSGEKDPEVYGAVARKYAQQVLMVLIRDVTDTPATAARYHEAFRDIPPARWRVFRSPEGLESIIPH